MRKILLVSLLLLFCSAIADAQVTLVRKGGTGDTTLSGILIGKWQKPVGGLAFPNDTTKFLRGDTTWAVPAGGGGVSLGDLIGGASSPGAILYLSASNHLSENHGNLFWDYNNFILGCTNLVVANGNLNINAVQYVFPGSQGVANTFLMNDGSGNLSWGNGGGGSPYGWKDDGGTPAQAPSVAAGTKGGAFGDSASVTAYGGLAIGNRSNVSNVGGLSIVAGSDNSKFTDSGRYSILITTGNGGGSLVGSSFTTAIGFQVYDGCRSNGDFPSGGWNTLIGANANCDNNPYNTCIGYSTTSEGGRSNLALGDGAYVTGNCSMSIGSNSGISGSGNSQINMWSEDLLQNFNASNFDSTTIINGNHLTARNAGEYLFGHGNKTGSNFLLQLSAGGVYSNPSTFDALSVLRDGTVIAGNPTATINGLLPSQGGNNGKLLTTDGTNTSWTILNGLTNWIDSLNTSAPNAMIPVAAFVAKNAATDVDAAILPKGKGAFELSIPVFKNGFMSVNMQIGSGVSPADGDSAVISGGFANEVDNLGDVIGGGGFNDIYGDYSSILGGYGNVIASKFSAIPGGRGMTLQGDGSFGFHAVGKTNSDGIIIDTANVSVFSNTDIIIANVDSVARAIKFYGKFINSASHKFPANTKFVGFKAPPVVTNSRTYILPPDDGTSGQVLSTDGSQNLSWATITPGTGTVTSVALALPNIFTVSGSPVTTSGTLTGALVSQSQNLILASPNGSSGAPTFRAIVLADLPATYQYYAWSSNSGTSFTATVANAYNTTAGSQATVTLPVATDNQRVLVKGNNTGGWIIALSGQTIHFPGQDYTVSIASTDGEVELVYNAATSKWDVINMTGTITPL